MSAAATSPARDTAAPQPVRRRKVFFLPGYDPFPARRYRELYRSEGPEQARISGYDLAVTPGYAGPTGWRVQSTQDGARVETDFEILAWSDIVRASMGGSVAQTYAQLLHTARIYIGSGTLWRLMRLRKGPVIAALYPAAVLLLEALVALLLGLGGAVLVLRFVTLIEFAIPLAVFGGVSLGYGLLNWFRRRDNRIFAYYLMHDYAFTAQQDGAYPDALEARLSLFGDKISTALSGRADEVLIVGHSSGAHLAVSVLADLLRQGRVVEGGPALGLLTLGQAIPMASFLPGAGRLRDDLGLLSTRPEVFWLDVTAPGDGCAFALCDPVAVSGVAPQTGQRGPLILSAAFSRTLSPERWRRLRRRFFRLHFQYLCAFDRPGDYDYFRITAGPMTLADRFQFRKHSKSRIATPVNRPPPA